MTSSDVENIFSLLNQNNISLEELFNNFLQKFPQENKRLILCHTLGQLIKNLVIFPKESERIIAIFIIYSVYLLNPENNKTLLFSVYQILKDRLYSNNSSEQNRNIIFEIYSIYSIIINTKQTSELTVTQLLNACKNNSINHQSEEIQLLFNKLTEELKNKYNVEGCDETNILPISNENISILKNQNINYIDDVGVIAKEILSNSESNKLVFIPPTINPVPPLYPFNKKEVIWLTPEEISHDLEWDYNMGKDYSKRDKIRHLMELSLKTQLSIHQQELVIQELKKDRKLKYICDITYEKFPKLVENNSKIAIVVLRQLINSPKFNNYLQILVNINISLASMEVVNNIAKATNFPNDLLHTYISNCISACEKKNNDTYIQCRQARLVCVFLQSLIRNKLLPIDEFFIEIQAFCVQFSKIREAVALFKTLNTLQKGKNDV